MKEVAVVLSPAEEEVLVQEELVVVVEEEEELNDREEEELEKEGRELRKANRLALVLLQRESKHLWWSSLF